MEENSVDQDFDRDRPNRSVKTDTAFEAPFAGHEDLQKEMPDIVVLIDEEIPMRVEIHRLQYRDDQQGSEVEWVQSR